MATCTYTYEEATNTMRISCPEVYGNSIEDSPVCMSAAIEKLSELKKITRIVFTGARETEYDPDEIRLLLEISNAIISIQREFIQKIAKLSEIKSFDQLFPDKLAFLRELTVGLRYDPIRAYKRLSRRVRHLKIKIKKLEAGQTIHELLIEKDPEICRTCIQKYLESLYEVLQLLESCELIKRGKDEKVLDRSFYRRIFHPSTRPSFMYTRFQTLVPVGAELIERYKVGDSIVEIYRVPGQIRKYYYLIPPEFQLTELEYNLLDTARRYLGKQAPTEFEATEPQRFRESIFNLSLDMLRDVARSMEVRIDEEKIRKLADTLARYTAGLGAIELLLADEKVEDILINSPIGNLPIYLVHGDHQECQTNIIPSLEDGESWATRFRLQSGRPLDEANPVLDTEIAVPGGKARVAAITRPLSPEGLAFALRRFREKPWTFPLFINAKYIDAFSAGLMWFMIDGSRTLLIGGTRGSGKTSFLGACMVQIMPKIRQILVEDSVDGNCKLLLRKDGKIWKDSIGSLIDAQIRKNGCRFGSAGHEICSNFDGIEVCALRNGLIEWMPIKSFIRHKVKKDILTIRTRTGREIKVTPDHSLFGLDKECRIAPIRAGKLSENSYVAVPRALPESLYKVDRINLLDHLEKFKDFFVASEKLKAKIKENWNEIKSFAKALDLSKETVRNWKERGILPCKIADTFLKNEKPQGLYIRPSRGGYAIPALLELDKDFLTFIGMWLGDGCYDKRSVIISATDEESRAVVRRVAKKFGIKVKMHSDGWSLILASKVLHKIMKDVLELRGDAYTKAFPNWIHSLSNEQIVYVLKGLYSSDGYTAAAEIGISLTSKELLWDVQTSLLRLGIISRLNRQSPIDKTWSLRISSLESIRIFTVKIGFLQNKRILWLKERCEKISTHDSTDVIPLTKATMEELTRFLQLNRHDYLTRGYALGRKKLQASISQLNTDGGGHLFERLQILANGDVFWDQIADIEHQKFEGYVYDLSVPECENFVCENFIAHNTLELPAVQLRELGFNIERLKARSVITRVETELPAEEALRTALRLGDSALILGEVRSREAIALYEAMRIGALANVVAGTIHGESPYGLFDRVVNDLGVPRTSFKATDIVMICNVLRSPDGLHRFRRLIDVTEVRKHWQEDPVAEGGFVNLLEYSAKEDRLMPSRTLLMGESQVLNAIADRVKDWKANWEAVWDNIGLRAKIFQTMVDWSVQLKRPDILEAPTVMQSNNQFHILSDVVKNELGVLDSKAIYDRWQEWLRHYVRGERETRAIEFE